MTNLDGEGEGYGYGEGKSLGNGHNQYGDADDEELDKVLDVHRSALALPRKTARSEHFHAEDYYEDEDSCQ